MLKSLGLNCKGAGRARRKPNKGKRSGIHLFKSINNLNLKSQKCPKMKLGQLN